MTTTQINIDNYITKTMEDLNFDGNATCNYIQFLQNNYRILEKKNYHTRTEYILIKSVTDNFVYTAPEIVVLYTKTIAFYMALENFKIPYESW